MKNKNKGEIRFFKSDSEHIWKLFYVAFPIRFLQMCLSLDALAAQIGCKRVFCISFNMAHNNNVKNR